jgi:hypothetical protein
MQLRRVLLPPLGMASAQKIKLQAEMLDRGDAQP